MISNNRVHGHVWRGIVSEANDTCPQPPTPDSFYATGNSVIDNILSGNLGDLEHHPNALGSTWAGNLCETTDGSEIPPCIPPGPETQSEGRR